MTSDRSSFSRRHLAGALSFLVIACSLGILVSSAGASRPAGRGQPIRALVIGEAHNPVLTELKHRVPGLNLHRTPVRHGSFRRFDLLIIDGDELSARQMAQRKLIKRFSDSGRWVLALDVGPRHHHRILARHTGFEALAKGRHHSEAFLFRHAVVGGIPRVIMLDSQRLTPTGTKGVTHKHRRASTRREVKRVARLIASRVRAPKRKLAGLTGIAARRAQDSGPPPEAIAVGYSYSVPGTHHPKDGYVGCGNHGYQDAQWTMNHNFTVYLDNSVAHPQGDFQIVTYDLQGFFNPARPGTDFWEMYQSCAPALTKYTLNRAWWTGLFDASVAPADAATDAKLTWQANAPNTPNQETTASSEEGFDVGISAEGPEQSVNLTYHASHGKSFSIPDWGVVSNTSGNHASWEFSSRHGCDPRAGQSPQVNCFQSPSSPDTYPNLPNQLSRSNMEVDASARWRTKQLLTKGNGMLSFTVADPVLLIDIGCTATTLGYCYRHDIDRDGSGPGPVTYSFDASAAIPVGIKSVNVDPATANGSANQKVTATVTLDQPAAYKTNVVVLSSKENAVVGSPVTDQVSKGVVTIAKGNTSGTITVQTNDNHLQAGGHVTAYITAFYAEAADPVPLRITRPKSG